MAAAPIKIDRTFNERKRIIRLLDFLKRENLTHDQMERIGKRLQKSGRRALNPLVRKLWREKNGTALYRYTCMLDFFDDSKWLDELVRITLRRKDIDEEGRLALLDALQDYGVDVTLPPFAGMTGYGADTLDGLIADCLKDGERGFVRFIDIFIDSADEVRSRMVKKLGDTGTPEALLLLGLLLDFESGVVVSEAAKALGRIKSGIALTLLSEAVDRAPAESSGALKRSMRRLSLLGVTEEEPLPSIFPVPLPLRHAFAGPVDIYGSRSIWFSWELPEGVFASLLLMTGDRDGMTNAISYRVSNEKEYDRLLDDMVSVELLAPVEQEYALSLLRDSIFQSRKTGSLLPPDFYLDRRFFPFEAIRPEPYLPRFRMECLDGIVEKIPGFIAASGDLLDNPALEGWLFSEPDIYDFAEELERLEAKGEPAGESRLEAGLERFCGEIILPRRGDLVKRLLFAADYMQQTGGDERVVQQTIATALSLVGGFLSESRHPFVRRLLLESIEAARHGLADGYDPRLEGDFDDDRE